MRAPAATSSGAAGAAVAVAAAAAPTVSGDARTGPPSTLLGNKSRKSDKGDKGGGKSDTGYWRYVSNDEVFRVVWKLMACLPSELPTGLLQVIHNWLETHPAEVWQGFMRPGEQGAFCVGGRQAWSAHNCWVCARIGSSPLRLSSLCVTV